MFIGVNIMENFYLFLISFFLVGMVFHTILVDGRCANIEEIEFMNIVLSCILILIFTCIIFGFTLGLQYRLNDYLSGM